MNNAQTSFSGPDRRRHPRFPAHLGAQLVVGGVRTPAPTIVRDLSQGGFAFTSDPDIIRYNWLLAIGFLAGNILCSGTGRVVRAAGAAYGVEFDDASVTLREFVSKLAVVPDLLDSVAGIEIHVA